MNTQEKMCTSPFRAFHAARLVIGCSVCMTLHISGLMSKENEVQKQDKNAFVNV